MPDSGVVFDASADRLLISTNVLNMNSNYTVIGRSKLNSDLNAAGIIFVLNDNNIASLAADYIGVASDGTGLAVDAIIAGTTTTVTGSQLRVGVLFTWGLRRIGNRLEAWLNGQLNCFLNVSIAGRAAATRLEVGAATTSNLSRTNGTHGNLIGYPYALDPRQMAAQMGNLDCALFPNVYGFWKTPKGTTYRTHDFSPNGRNFTEGGTLADAPLEPVVFDPIQRWWVRGNFTWNVTLTGALNPSGQLIKQPLKTPSGATNPSGGLLKLASKLTGGAQTPSGQASKTTTKIYNGAQTPSGAATRTATKLLTAAHNPSGLLVRLATKGFSGSGSLSGLLIKQAQKLFSGGETASGDLTTLKAYLRSFTGAVSPSGNLLKQAMKVFTAALAPSGQTIKQALKILSGAETPAGALSTLKAYLRAFTGDLSPVGQLVKLASKRLSGSASTSGAATQTATKIASGVMAPGGQVLKQANKNFGGATNPGGVVARTATKWFGGTVASAGSLVKSARKVLGGLIGAIGDFFGQIVGGEPEIDLDPDVYVVPRRNAIFISDRANEEFESARENEVFIVPRD